MLRWLSQVGRGAVTALVAVAVLLLGLVPRLHAIGPTLDSSAPAVISHESGELAHVVAVYLAAYRSHGPPGARVERIASLILVAQPRKTGQSARLIVYAYCRGEPVNRWDPTGLDDVEIIGDTVFWVVQDEGKKPMFRINLGKVEMGHGKNDSGITQVHMTGKIGMLNFGQRDNLEGIEYPVTRTVDLDTLQKAAQGSGNNFGQPIESIIRRVSGMIESSAKLSYPIIDARSRATMADWEEQGNPFTVVNIQGLPGQKPLSTGLVKKGSVRHRAGQVGVGVFTLANLPFQPGLQIIDTTNLALAEEPESVPLHSWTGQHSRMMKDAGYSVPTIAMINSAPEIAGLATLGLGSFATRAEISVLQKEMVRRTVLSGHGALEPGAGFFKTPVPVTFWGNPGSLLDDEIANLIETGQEMQILNSKWMQYQVRGATTHLPGSYVPNYTLYPIMPGDGIMILGNPKTVAQPTSLKELLRQMNGPVDWAACQEIMLPIEVRATGF